MKLTEFKDKHAKLVNMTYGELSDTQKQTLYAMEIYNDSHDALIACDIYATPPSPDYIDDQLRNTFGYNDTTVIE